MEALSAEAAARIERILGAPVTRSQRVRRGYTNAERWVLGLADGRSVFTKIGVSDHSATALRNEAHHLEQIRAPFAPAMLAFEDGEHPIIVLEDLSAAHWPPPWTTDAVERMRAALEQLSRHPVPDGTRLLSDSRPTLSGWKMIANDPTHFRSLGVVTDRWLERALPALRDAEDAAKLDGDVLCHFDVRSDNMCLTDERAVLVDWNGLRRGPPGFDLAAWAPSLHFEGGPAPEELVGDQPEYAAMISGYFAWAAGRPPEDWAGFERIRQVQREQLTTALPWALRALGLAPLDGPVPLEQIVRAPSSSG